MSHLHAIGHSVHFDTDHPDGRLVGDGTVIDVARNCVLIEVTQRATKDLSIGERLWIPADDAAPLTPA